VEKSKEGKMENRKRDEDGRKVREYMHSTTAEYSSHQASALEQIQIT